VSILNVFLDIKMMCGWCINSLMGVDRLVILPGSEYFQLVRWLKLFLRVYIDQLYVRVFVVLGCNMLIYILVS